MPLIRPRYAFYGDDFTGATDTLSTLSNYGWSTLLLLRSPTNDQLRQAVQFDCVGLAGTARSLQGSALDHEIETAATFFKHIGAPIAHYKVCSTFDSSPTIGSIGQAVRQLRKRIAPDTCVPIVGGQPNLGRFCAFSNLFAAFQHGGEVYRVDRHPTMSHHPVTPAYESDLRRHLAKQGLSDLGQIDLPCYDQSATALSELLQRAALQHKQGLVFDLTHPWQLPLIGRCLIELGNRRPLLAVGPSSVAQALCEYWNTLQDPRSSSARKPEIAPAQGPVLVLSGSRSPLTTRQIKAANSFHHLPLDISTLCSPRNSTLNPQVASVVQLLKQGRHVLAYVPESSDDTGHGKPPIEPVVLARACGEFLNQVLNRFQPDRIGIAGGDTSSYSIRALDAWGLAYIAQLDTGAALCQLHSDLPTLNGIEIMLKGGQMGSLDIFERLIHGSGANRTDHG